MPGRLRIREVANIAGKAPLIQRFQYCVLIHQKIPRIIDQDSRRLHQRDGILANHLFCTVKKRNMDRNIIALPENGLHIIDVPDGTAQVPGPVDGNIGIISIYLHPEMYCCVRNQVPDRAKPDHAELLPGKLCPGKFLFLLFDILFDILVVRVFLHPVNASHDITGCKQHACKDHLLDAVRICARRIENDDPL